ncbi:MAG TPA: hypothetical protein VMW27_12840 [Thermoanaerobaculia bacterium]|nr:hypothetical protein [Thermoanaerobaculia bacterium]
MKRAALCACLCLLLTTSVLAQTAEPAKPASAASPETVVQSYLDLMKKGQYNEMAAAMHPEALEKFRSMLLSVAEEMPGATEPGGMLSLFKGVSSAEALKKLSPVEFFASFFAGMSELNPVMKELLASIQSKALGSVKEGDTVHVVCRTTAGFSGASMDKMEVVSVKQHQGQWKVLLSGDIQNMAQAIRNSIAQAQTTE